MNAKSSMLLSKRCVLTGLLMLGLFPFQASSTTGWSFSFPGNYIIYFGGTYYPIRVPYAHQQGITAQTIHEYHVNFGQTFPLGKPSSHLDYQVFQSPISASLGMTKFIDLKHYHSSSTGKCLEYQMMLNNNADWLLWANMGTRTSPNWVKLSDDVAGNSPAARVWIQGSVSDDITRVRLATYNEGVNNSSGVVYVADLGAISQATCEAPNISVLRLIGSGANVRFIK